MTNHEAAPSVSFRTAVELAGKTATGLEVPASAVADLGQGKRPAVQVSIGRHTYRSTIAVMDGRYMVPLSAENRKGASVAAGDVVDVVLTLDTEPRVVEVPADFATALTADPVAKEFFDSLSYSNQRWHVLSVEGAKTEATRERRIAKSVGMLAEHRKR